MKSNIQLFTIITTLLLKSSLVIVVVNGSTPRIPRTNLGIRIQPQQQRSSSSTTTTTTTATRRARGGASAVAATGAVKTMSASQYKILKYVQNIYL